MSLFVTDNKKSMYYQVVGSAGASEVIVLLAGLTRDHTVWRKVVPLLENKYKLILVDNRDVGQSSAYSHPYELYDMADDVIELLQHLQLSLVHVVGHSLGGFISFHIAAKAPEIVKSLILCNTDSIQTEHGIGYLDLRIRTAQLTPIGESPVANLGNIVSIMPYIYSEATLSDASFVAEIADYDAANPYPQSPMSFINQAKAARNHNADGLLADIRCPVLIVTGEDDELFTSEAAYVLSDKMHNTTVEILASVAHMPQLEAPEGFSKVISDFVDKQSL
ncbi:MAG: alpha/beta hydrolase [Coxiellaceae bacterium]|nr:alpha/beta hydrolase [Coxiellaceae bacterium]